MIYQSGVGLTPLEIRFAPPKRKGIKWWIIGILIMTPVPFVVVDMLQMPNAKGATIKYIITMSIWASIMAWGLLGAIRYNKNQWPDLVKRWREAFLCSACGTMFKPE